MGTLKVQKIIVCRIIELREGKEKSLEEKREKAQKYVSGEGSRIIVVTTFKYKNRIRAELRKRGVEIDGVNIWTKEGNNRLKELGIGPINDFLEVMQTLNDRVRELEKKIKKIAGEMEEAQLLMTIPGVSYYSALTIIAEIATVERFPTSEHLCSYAGLAPSTKQSGSKETHGSIQGGRPLLRWILYQCAFIHIQNSPISHITKFYKKLTREKPKKLANTAAARKLLKVTPPNFKFLFSVYF